MAIVQAMNHDLDGSLTMSELTDQERRDAVATAARLERETGVSVDGVPLTDDEMDLLWDDGE